MFGRNARFILLACAILCVGGCASTNKEYADRNVENFELFSPYTRAGIQSHPTLSDADKQIRLETYDSWGSLLKTAAEEAE